MRQKGEPRPLGKHRLGAGVKDIIICILEKERLQGGKRTSESGMGDYKEVGSTEKRKGGGSRCHPGAFSEICSLISTLVNWGEGIEELKGKNRFGWVGRPS